jgi:oxepin-CoA hydrolase/3-oxo-5,6-dehydrosuberyl-CoA semialdehyde dehydrogenase
MTGADRTQTGVHPFRKYFDDLEIGETLVTEKRTVTHDDVANFADLSGDHFYAHKDGLAAQSIFERKVAHGYFVLSAAAGLFVDPAPGPVLANYGLESLRFVNPVYPGDTIQAKLTVKQKTAKETPAQGLGAGVPQGIVAWDVEVTKQTGELAATYTILTLVRRRD